VEAPERVKGFEVAKGTFVHVPEEQLEKLASERSKVIAIRKFIPLNQVDELAVEKSYYLAPNDKLAVSYILLADAMVKHGVVGFGYQSLWGKETPALIWPAENGPLILSPMFCYDEVAQSEEIVSVMSSVGAQIPDEAHNLASDYVALNVSDFNPQEDLVSSSRNRIEEFLSSLVSGIDFEAIEPEPAPEPTFDIVDQLRASIAQTRQPA
jgi:DNA end-binding protein Ku